MFRFRDTVRRAVTKLYFPEIAHNYSSQFQSHTTAAISRMSPSKQKALISFYMIRYIRYFNSLSYLEDNRSIRQRLMCRSQFNRFVLQNVAHYSGNSEIDPSINQEWLNDNLEQSSYKEVIRCFFYSKGANFNPKITQQKRMTDVMNDVHEIILFPTLITKQYFRKISSISSSILSGEKGVGKSFSFLSYEYFSRFIISYRLQLPATDKMENKIAPIAYLQKIPKICYINLTDVFSFQPYFSQIYRQFLDLFPINEFNADWLQNTTSQKFKIHLADYLIKLSNKTIEKKIQTVLVIDEANRIFSLFRQLTKMLKEIKPEEKEKDKQYFRKIESFKELKFYSELLEIVVLNINTNFSRVILNSSQDYEISYAENLDKQIKSKLNIIKIFNQLRLFYDKNERNKQKRVISFSQYLDREEMQIELYNVLWFEIIQQLKKIGVFDQQIKAQDQVQLLKQHKKVFFEAFQSSQSKQKYNIRYKLWRNDVRQLDISKHIENYSDQTKDKIILFERSNNVFLSRNIQAFKQTLMNNFNELKEKIQESRLQDIISCLRKYYQKAIDEQDYINIINYITDFMEEAENKIQEQGPFYEYICTMIPSQDRPSFIASLGFGYDDISKQIINDNNQKVADGCIRVTTSPSMIIEAISKSQMTSEYSILVSKKVIAMLLQDTQKMSDYLGRVLDNLTYPVFRSRKFNICLLEHSKIEKIRLNFRISNTFSFQGFTKICNTKQECLEQISRIKKPTVFPITQEDLKAMFKKIQQNLPSNGSYYGFYPVVKSKGERNSEITFLRNQQSFDSFMMRKNQQQLDCIFFDWTMGTSKGQGKQTIEKLQSRLNLILSLIDFPGKINAQYYIVAPQYYAEDYRGKITEFNKFNESTDKKFKLLFATFNSQTPFSEANKINQQLISIVSQIYKREETYIKQRKAIKLEE